MRQAAEAPSAAGWRRRTTARRATWAGTTFMTTRARVDRTAAGHVEADAVDGQPALGDRAAGHDLGGRVGSGAGPRARSAHGGSTPRARRGPSGSSSASAESSASCGTRRLGGRTPSSFSPHSSTASVPRWRTSSTIGRTTWSTLSTSTAARGSTSRGSTDEPRRSMRRITPPSLRRRVCTTHPSSACGPHPETPRGCGAAAGGPRWPP